MDVAIVTRSGGLIGSENARHLAAQGLQVVGIDNDMRSLFFGKEASTKWAVRELHTRLGERYRHHGLDIRDREEMEKLFEAHGRNIKLIVHAAAQPSHDWAARDPQTDFTINALGTLILLEATRKFSPEAVFIFMSTNKVYGDEPNRLPLVEKETRWEIAEAHPYAARGIDECMTIDHSQHSLFGASKVAAVYSSGGSRFSNCSLLEAVQLAEEATGRKLHWTYCDQPRSGDNGRRRPLETVVHRQERTDFEAASCSAGTT